MILYFASVVFANLIVSPSACIDLSRLSVCTADTGKTGRLISLCSFQASMRRNQEERILSLRKKKEVVFLSEFLFVSSFSLTGASRV